MLKDLKEARCLADEREEDLYVAKEEKVRVFGREIDVNSRTKQDFRFVLASLRECSRGELCTPKLTFVL